MVTSTADPVNPAAPRPSISSTINSFYRRPSSIRSALVYRCPHKTPAPNPPLLRYLHRWFWGTKVVVQWPMIVTCLKRRRTRVGSSGNQWQWLHWWVLCSSSKKQGRVYNNGNLCLSMATADDGFLILISGQERENQREEEKGRESNQQKAYCNWGHRKGGKILKNLWWVFLCS